MSRCWKGTNQNLAQHSSTPRDCPDHLSSLLEIGSPPKPDSAVNVLLQLAVSMRAHGRGGALLVVPQDSAEWRDSIQSISYPVTPPFVSCGLGAQQ